MTRHHRRGFTGYIGDLIDDSLDRADDVEHGLRRAARRAVEERDDRYRHWDRRDDDWDRDRDDWDWDWDRDCRDRDCDCRERGGHRRHRHHRHHRGERHRRRWDWEDWIEEDLEEILDELEDLYRWLRRHGHRHDRRGYPPPGRGGGQGPGDVRDLTERLAYLDSEVRELSQRVGEQRPADDQQ